MRFPTIIALAAYSLAACGIVFCASFAGAGAAPAGERAVVEKVIRDNIGWALTKDRPLAESTMAHDGRLFIFSPDSQVTVGWDQHAKGFDFWMDPRFKARKLDIRDMRIDISRSGDVAWWSCILDDLAEWDGKPIGWKDTRWTGVLEKRGGKWLIVQMHFSFASDKVVAEAKARMQAQGADALQAALDYIEGWYEGDAARVERVLHPEFVRRIAAVTVAGDDFFWPQDRAQFLEATRRGGDKATPSDQRRIKATVRDLARTTAVVRVDSAYYVEYLSLVKLRDRWQVVNVLWENVPNDRKEVEIDARVLADYAGTYRHENGSEFRVIIEGKRIFLQQGGDPRIEFFPESETDFFTKGYKSGITFVRDAAGKVTQLVKHVNYRDFTFKQIKQNATGGSDYAVIFYSGRGDNQDVYILHPGEKEPVNLTRHPARDNCPAPSPDGKSIVFLSNRGGNFDIFSMRIDGSDIRQLTNTPENEEHPEFSPDGKKIIFVRDFEKKTEIWIMDADGTNPRRLTNNEARDERPFLSPDGSKILFMSNRDGNYEIYTMAPDGSGQTRITDTPHWEIFPVWSPDGKEIAYARKFRAEGRMQGMIRVMNADGSNDREITKVETRDENPMWSPDGRFIIFQSVRDGNFEVYQVNRDGSDAVRLTDHPAWDGWASFVPRQNGK